MKRKITWVLIIAMLCTLCFAGCGAKTSALTPDKGNSYFVHIGLADADTLTQKLTMNDALTIVRQTLTEKKQGATVLPGWGGFVGDDGVYHENETILVMLNTEEAATSALIEQWKTELHVASVYVVLHEIQYGITGGQI